MSHDPVENPAHYDFPIQPLDAIEAWSLGYHAGNVVKYLVRAPHKGAELEDLNKAAEYLRRLIALREKAARDADPVAAKVENVASDAGVTPSEFSAAMNTAQGIRDEWQLHQSDRLRLVCGRCRTSFLAANLGQREVHEAQCWGGKGHAAPGADQSSKQAENSVTTADNESSVPKWLTPFVQGEFVCSKCNHIVVKRWLSAHEARCWESE